MSKDIEENKAIAAISYIGPLCLIPLLAKKDSAFAQYHAKQGLILFIAEVILSFLYGIPFIGWFLIAPLGGLFTFILFIIGLLNALGGKTKPLPLIGDFADKLKF